MEGDANGRKGHLLGRSQDGVECGERTVKVAAITGWSHVAEIDCLLEWTYRSENTGTVTLHCRYSHL